MSQWWRKRKEDYYYREAKKKKYRSRAAFKLLQIQRKYNVLRKGDVVVDLGCWPGGWLQVSRQIVGETGFVVGVDLKETEPIEGVKVLKADITKASTIERLKEVLPREADAVLCDCSPSISGSWGLDQARQIDLAIHSFKIACELLRRKGNYVTKVFQGRDAPNFLSLVKGKFGFVKLYRPPATRKKSSEIYLIAKYFSG